MYKRVQQYTLDCNNNANAQTQEIVYKTPRFWQQQENFGEK